LIANQIDETQALCLECGLCCNGVIFADVKLQREDNRARLEALGLPVEVRLRAPRFRQPCEALDGCFCRIYGERPKYCREFECYILKNLQANRLDMKSARQVVRTARGRALKVAKLLESLGDTETTVSLSQRFRRTARRLEQLGLDPKQAELYGQLTLAMHGLNLMLSESFYAVR
jgi:Fe-S-cluster containining protein